MGEMDIREQLVCMSEGLDVYDRPDVVSVCREAADTIESLRSDLAAMTRERDEAKAVVETLPKTRDGKPIHPGMHIWDEGAADDFDREYPSETNMLVTTVTNYAACASQGEDTSEYEQSYRCGQDDCCQECDGSRSIGNVWSTRSAAESAKEADNA